jgi:uncharacterized protein DUF3352
MNLITRPTMAVLLLLIALTITTTAQQKRQMPAKPQPKAAAAPTPAPTFDTLIPADSYTLYGEVRGVGQLIRSNTLNDMLEPVLKLAGPPKEFKSVVRWLNAHAEQLMSSRMLVATSPTNPNVPSTLIAIEFGSAEEAAKFVTPLNEFLPTVVPTPVPETAVETKDKTNFHLQHLGSLVVLTQRPWTMKQLKPAGSKLLSEDVNFRTARNRFNSEPIFVFVDMKSMEKQDEEQRKRAEELHREEIERLKREAGEKESKESAEDRFELTEQVKDVGPPAIVALEKGAKETPAPDPIWDSLSELGASFFRVETRSPEAIGLALSFEGDSFDLRALLVSQAAEKVDAIPFIPTLVMGAPFSPEAPNIFPADTELIATMSLDLPQIYAAMSKPLPRLINRKGQIANGDPESPFVAIEQRLKINLKDDLLPLLGSEVAISLPMKDAPIIGAPQRLSPNAEEQQESATSGPAIAIAVKDKEGVRALMPKLIENLGFKGASSLAQTERREDTEIVSFANVFSYAFIGNFVVLSANPATTRHVVDCYLKHETLAADTSFRNSTRWQPRPLNGQLYISPSFMEGFKSMAEQPAVQVPDQVKAFFMRASMMPQPITYSLSNEGLGPLHEVHIPKDLILMAVAGISGEVNPPPMVQKERMAISLMYRLAGAETEYKTKNGSYGSLEQLIAADLIPKGELENSSYKIELILTGDKFEITGVPVEYGKSGKLSFFLDHTYVMRGGDKNGASASVSDPPIH